MRYIYIILTMLLVFNSSALCTTDTSFDKFIKSRDVVDTFFFKSNTDVLSKDERKRLENIVNTLRELQKSGRMIRVEGFSSPEGDQEENFKLSFYRAKTVADLIQGQGLPAEVTLTGYGDLRSSGENQDLAKERRVEIVSYLKPSSRMRRIQVADDENNKTPAPVNKSAEIKRRIFEIDSYRVDQAIRTRVDDRNKGLAEGDLEKIIIPDLTHFEDNFDVELERGYTLWRKSVDPEYAMRIAKAPERASETLSSRLSKVKPLPVPGDAQPTFSKVKPIALPGSIERGYSQAQPAEAEEIQRGYSQAQPAEAEEIQRGYSQAQPAEAEEIQRGYSQAQPAEAEEIQRGYSQAQPAEAEEIQRGYSQAQPAEAEEIQRGYSQAQPAEAEEIQRGYSQAQPAEAEEIQRGYSQAQPAEAEEIQRGYSQAQPAEAEEIQRGYSQAQPAEAEEIQRGYSQAQPAEAEEIQRGYSQAQPAEAEEIQRGYSQIDPETLPGVTQILPPVIDALMIEQAIMEKIGMVEVAPSGSVSQVSMDFQGNDSSN